MKTQILFFKLFVVVFCFSTFYAKAQSTSTTNIYLLASEPTIDGVADAAWSDFPVLPIIYQDGTPAVVRSSNVNLGATYQVGWKGSKLFFLVKVTDDIPFYSVAATQKYLQDYVSIYFNLNSTHLTDAGKFDPSLPQWYFLTNLNPAPELMNMAGHGGPSNAGTGWAWPSSQAIYPAGKQLAWAATTSGYNVEIMLDFSDAGWLYTGTLADGVTLGFDVEVNDVDALGGSRTQIFWSNSGVGTEAYDNVVGFGNGTIVDSAPNANNSGIVTSVKLNPVSANLVIGSKAQLTVTVLPSYATNKSVNWSSSNVQVATVSSTGQVTGIGIGEAVITVTTADQAKTAICNVKVSNLIKILPFGESTTDGGGGGSYRKILSDSLIAHNVAFDFIGSKKLPANATWDADNQGMSGSACRDLSTWIKANSSAYKADIILLWEGTNDCGWGWQWYGTPISALSTLIDDICANQPQAELFVSTIPAMGSNAYSASPWPAGASANAYAIAYNAAIPALIDTKIAQGKKVHFLDTRGVIQLADLNGDGIHPTQNGYNKMAPYWFNAIKPYLGLTTGLDLPLKKSASIKSYSVDNKIIVDLTSVTGSVDISIFHIDGRQLISRKLNGGKMETIKNHFASGVYVVKINNAETQQSTKIFI